MPAADPARCPSCGAERPANAPGGLCPRCVLRHAMESGGSSDDTPAPGPALATIALAIGSVRQVRLLDADATDADGPDGPAEVPAAAGDAAHLELLGEIARGGMGAILKGRDPGLGRDLAVKVLLESHKDKPDLARRFIEEAQIAGQLQHPGVVPVYELGAFADSRPFFTMKLVKGRTLAALLEDRSAVGAGSCRRSDRENPDGPDRGQEPPTEDRRPTAGPRPLFDDLPRFIAIFEQVSRTMAYAHARGVIHRDLKPSNIMVGGFGEVQVMDWGLAKVLASGGVADESRAVQRQDRASFIRTLRTGSDADASQAGSVMGTPAYMPPEQAGGDVEALDERADVFGLGAILCEILTGDPPYVGRDGNEVFRKAIRGDLVDAMARLDSCGSDEELIALARSCLAPELLDRPRDARIVSERLTEHLAGVQERLRAAELARAAEAARAIEAVRKARAERQARRLAAGLAAAVLAAVGLIGGGAAWFVSVRDARRAAAAREVDDLIGRVVVLKAKAHAAPPGEVAPWKEALAESARAAERVRDLADPERTDRIARDIAALKEGLGAAEVQAARLDVDHKLLAELESVRGGRAEHADRKRTDRDYADAFRKAGFDLDATEAKQAGAWIAARSAPLELASFLDDWATVRQEAGSGETAWGRLVAAARAADRDPWRDALRASRGTKGPEALAALRTLADNEEALQSQPAEGLRLLALRLKAAGDREAAARVLNRAWRARPDDFWVNYDLADSRGAGGGTVQELFPRPEEAVRYLTAALAVRPRSVMAHTSLGNALHAQGKLAEAVAEYREAIQLKPDYASARHDLAVVLHEQGKLAEAIAKYREAIRLKPELAVAHSNLGHALQLQGKLAEAVAEYREAIRLRPDFALAHYNFGITLRGQGKLAEAVAEYREAIRLRPDFAKAHANLGLASSCRGTSTGRWPSCGRPATAPARNPSGSSLASPAWSPRPSDRSACAIGSRECWRAATGPPARPRASTSPTSPTIAACTPPRRGCMPRPSPPTPSWPTIERPSIATTPPAPPRWPAAARARTIPLPTRRRGPTCGSRPSTGSGPSWRPGAASSTRATRWVGRASRRPYAPGRRTPTLPASAIPRPWPGSPRPSGRYGNPSGPMSIACSGGRKEASHERPETIPRSARRRGPADRPGRHGRPGLDERLGQPGDQPRRAAPCVLLRDTDADGRGHPEPPSRPGSAEMPAPGAGPARLQLLGEIARGGMGAVLKGRDPGLCRDMAVKVLLEKHRDDADLTRRFVEEAQIAGQLQHPGIVPVYRFGTMPDRRPYFTMKLVKGRTLAALLAERPDPVVGAGSCRRSDRAERVGPVRGRDRAAAGGPDRGQEPPPTEDHRPADGPGPRFDDLPRFISIFEQVCRTMSYAHARGVIHRDLKPSNIMVGGFGEVQVMDWGLAKVLARGEPAPPADDPSSPTETVVATARSGSGGSDLSRAARSSARRPTWPPSRPGAKSTAFDARADVFALGAILCEMLTGRPPYAGRNPAEVQRKAARGDTAEALAAIDASGADPELIALARECLAAEPDDRPADARAVADRVAAHLAGVGERLRKAELDRAAEAARAEEAEEAAGVERRARRLTVGLAAAVLILIGLAGGGYAWLESDRAIRRAATERAVAAELDRAETLRAEALAAPADRPGPWDAALAAVRGAMARLEQGEPDAALRQRVADAIRQVKQGRDEAVDRAARIAADRALLAELESARGGYADHGDARRTDADYAAAFRNAGLDLDATEAGQAGAWIAARTAPAELAAFLDDWALIRRRAGADEEAAGRLVAAARAADKDPWRNALRAGIRSRGPEALAALHKLAADEPALESQPVEGLRLLALRLRAAGDRDAAARVLRRAWRKRPDDFWVNFDLARSRGAESGTAQDLFPRPEEAVRHLTAALAVRPRSVVAHNSLGNALHAQGKLAEAVAAHREAVRLKPDSAITHSNLGAALRDQGKLAEAVAAHREAIRLRPDYAPAHYNLGLALRDQGKLAEAVAAHREAIRLQPDSSPLHSNLGVALSDQGKLAEAVAEYREAIRLRPDLAGAHANLGFALDALGHSGEAIEAWRRSVSLNPRQPSVWYWIGRGLLSAGRRDEVAEPFRRVLALYPAGSLQALEARQVLSGSNPYARLWGIVKGTDRPKDDQEAILFARMATTVAQYGVAVQLWAEALAADPQLGEDRQTQHRYAAACTAALAGCGRGETSPRPATPSGPGSATGLSAGSRPSWRPGAAPSTRPTRSCGRASPRL